MTHSLHQNKKKNQLQDYKMGSSTSKPDTSDKSHPVNWNEIGVNTQDADKSSTTNNKSDSSTASYPTPTGREYDLIDELASELPSIIDDESKRQVEEYIASCDNGKGPMVACHSTAEYLSLFERKHTEAMKLYENCCFRPKGDKSPNGVYIEENKTNAYPPSCYNLAQFRMTGKGRTKFDRKEGYDLFERACKGNHNPACLMQAKMLVSPPGSLGPKIPYDPSKAMDLFNHVCEQGDSIACFTLATMLLRGNLIDPAANNVSPKEASGDEVIKNRAGEQDRKRKENDTRKTIPRDPKRAEQLLLQSCGRAHAPSCFNLAVMYNMGDDGVERDHAKAQKFQDKTQELVKLFGGFGFNGKR